MARKPTPSRRSRATRRDQRPPAKQRREARPNESREPSFHDMVWNLVRSIPRGRATSYGAIAAYLGAPRAARGVGWAMAALPPDSDVPWWRVVNRNGEISIKGAPGLPALQRSLLESEGIAFGRKGRIDLRKFGWAGPA